MTFMQYLSRTVYRYYINQIVNKAQAIFFPNAGIMVQIDFRNPRTKSDVNFRNPRTKTQEDFRNPRTKTEENFEIRTESGL